MSAIQAEEQLIVFGISGQHYGMNVSEVAEVIRMVAIDDMPGSPDWMLGLVNLRGTVLPIVDLRCRLGIEAEPIGLTTPIIVTRDKGLGRIGLIVDLVDDMVDLPRNDIQPADNNSDLRGVVKIKGKLVILVKLERLIDDTQKVMHGV